MKKNSHLFITPVIFFFSCHSVDTKNKLSAEEIDLNQKVQIERSPLFESYTTEKLNVANFIEEYLNVMYDSTLQTRNNYWHSSILIHAQDDFLRNDLPKGLLLKNPPQLIGIRELNDDQFLATVNFSMENYPLKIMKLKIAKDGLGRFYFIDLFGENIKQFQQTQTENCTFFYSPKVNPSKKQEQKTVDFNKKMASFFGSPLKSVKVIVLQDISDYCEVLGYEYSPTLTYDKQTGGIAMPNENMVLIANNSSYYPHEIVHLYTGNFNPHNWFDEGLATYLGGSVEQSLSQHLQKIANQTEELDFSMLPNDHKIDDDTSFKYAIGGLLCKLAYEKHGSDALSKLLQSGRSEQDFHDTLNSIFQLNPKDYDNFIKNELEAYKS